MAVKLKDISTTWVVASKSDINHFRNRWWNKDAGWVADINKATRWESPAGAGTPPVVIENLGVGYWVSINSEGKLTRTGARWWVDGG